MFRPRRRFVALVLTPFAAGAGAAEPPEFVALGDVGLEEISSAAGAISADGLVVTGRCTPPGSQRVFRWTLAGGMVSLGGPNLAIGTGANADGSVLVCNSATLAGDSLAYRWTQVNGFVPLPGLTPSSPGPRVFGVSADGGTAVGESSTPLVATAVVWNPVAAVTPLSNEPGFSSYSARGISGDGSVIVGSGSGPGLGAVAFRWTSAGGTVVLPDLAGGAVLAAANAVSSDGTITVGYVTTESGQEAAKWSGGIPSGLSDLAGGTIESNAFGVSANGKIIVGYGTTDTAQEAFVWDADNGMRNLKQVLQGLGVTTVSGWTLSRAVGVSGSGGVIVGYGTNPMGRTEAWLARVPVSCYANCDGSIAAPSLTANDFLCFINRFVNGESYANCDGSVANPVLNINDFQCFITRFSEGCP